MTNPHPPPSRLSLWRSTKSLGLPADHDSAVRVEVADDQACLWLGQLLPDPGHPVNAGGVEPSEVSGVPYADGSLVICRETIENGQVHILIVPARSGALVPRQDRQRDDLPNPS